MCQHLLVEGIIRQGLWRRWHFSRELNAKQELAIQKILGKVFQAKRTVSVKALLQWWARGASMERRHGQGSWRQCMCWGRRKTAEDEVRQAGRGQLCRALRCWLGFGIPPQCSEWPTRDFRWRSDMTRFMLECLLLLMGLSMRGFFFNG